MKRTSTEYFCRGCGQTFPATRQYFYVSHYRADGSAVLRNRCKKCQAADIKRTRDKERRRKTQREWRRRKTRADLSARRHDERLYRLRKAFERLGLPYAR